MLRSSYLHCGEETSGRPERTYLASGRLVGGLEFLRQLAGAVTRCRQQIHTSGTSNKHTMGSFTLQANLIQAGLLPRSDCTHWFQQGSQQDVVLFQLGDIINPSYWSVAVATTLRSSSVVCDITSLRQAAATLELHEIIELSLNGVTVSSHTDEPMRLRLCPVTPVFYCFCLRQYTAALHQQ